MVITSIEKQKRANRYNIFLDGAFGFGISIDVLLKFNLHTGNEFDSETLEAIQREEELRSARQSALLSLGRSMRSEREIRQKLTNKKYNTEVIENVIAQLKENDFINDERFSKAFVSDRSKRKKIGVRLLKQQLIQKGITKHLIEQSLQEVTNEQEFELASALARKKITQLNSSSKMMTELQKRRRVGEQLMRHGFSSETSRRVLMNELKRSAEIPEDDEE